MSKEASITNNLVVTICASRLYLYAWKSVVRRIISAIGHHPEGTIVFVSDKSEACDKAAKFLRDEVLEGWKVNHYSLKLDVDASDEAYQIKSQLLIATLQGEAFAQARKLRAERVWNIEADILPRSDTLRVLEWALSMPTEDGSSYYDIAEATYNNGLFMGGRGSYTHPIAQDVTPEERIMPEELKIRYEEIKKEESEWIKSNKIADITWQEKAKSISDEIIKCPPSGNVWKRNAENGWKPRGWIDEAYPAVGKGALVPVDWIGTGCVLLSKRALAMATFEGYDGKGTQDLYLCWRRWNPAGLRMCASTHSICDHVKHKKGEDGKIIPGEYTLFEALHETMGDCVGHLRVVHKPWIAL